MFPGARGWIFGLAFVGSVLCATAQTAPYTRLYPLAAQQGTTVSVSLIGKAPTWPPQVWVDAPGITFKPGSKAPTMEVEIAKDAAPGPHFVRFYHEKGALPPALFIVSTEPELREAEPNNSFEEPQKIERLPATISGRLDKNEDVDSYAVTLKKGQTLVAWLEAYVLGAPFDGLLRIVDGRTGDALDRRQLGTELAYNHDDRTLDPFLAWQAPGDGTYIVQVAGFAYPATSSVQFAGGENDVYRLHLCAGPFVHHTVPLALPQANPKPARLIGFNLPPNPSLEQAHVQTPIPQGEGAEEIERAPHDPAQALPLAGGLTGEISQAGEEDRYTFTAQKQHTYELKVVAAAFGSPLDGWLKVEGAGGKELARNDDAAASRDPQLTWTAPADGSVTVAIGDVAHHGGSAYFYRLAIKEAVPAAEGTIAATAFTIAPGKTTDLKVQCKRLFKYAAKLELIAKGLPEGVSAKPVEVPAKDGEVTLKLTATAEAAPANGPFQLVLKETEGEKEFPVRNVLLTMAENNGVPNGYTTLLLPEVRDLWLTVAK